VPIQIRNVTVIGAGPLGRRLADLCCRAGYITTLEDVLPSNLRNARAELAGEHHASLLFAASVPEAVREADLVLDTVPDELESKLEIFSMVDRMAPPRTIMMTPTAIHSIADLASCTYRGDRCLSFEVPAAFASGEAISGNLRVIETKETAPEVHAEIVNFWARAGWTAEVVIDPALLPAATLR
jgi:3-hydroxybutyryl-CoA dehydrogenase